MQLLQAWRELRSLDLGHVLTSESAADVEAVVSTLIEWWVEGGNSKPPGVVCMMTEAGARMGTGDIIPALQLPAAGSAGPMAHT